MQRSRKQGQLEKSWDSNVSILRDQKRFVQMSSDIKKFLLQPNDTEETKKLIEKSKLLQKHPSAVLNTYDKIYSTLGFEHHEGTDYQLELKIVKTIMIREELINSLKYQISLISKQIQRSSGDSNTRDANVMNANVILELLSQLREKTLNFLEFLVLWRQSAAEKSSAITSAQFQSADSFVPKAFMWANQNYTMKIVHDLDFLCENGVIVDSLHLLPQQLVANPLMLNNNLEDMNTWMDPYDRAMLDVTNENQVESEAMQHPQFEIRLRLRLAERMLLQEIENSSNTQGNNVFITQTDQSAPPSAAGANNQKVVKGYEKSNSRVTGEGNNHETNFELDGEDYLYKGSSILENDDDSEFGANHEVNSANVQSFPYRPPQIQSEIVNSMPHSRSSTISSGNGLLLNGTGTFNNNYDYFSGHWQSNAGGIGVDSAGDEQEDEILYRYEDDMYWQGNAGNAANQLNYLGVNEYGQMNPDRGVPALVRSNSDDAVMLYAEDDDLLQLPSSRDGITNLRESSKSDGQRVGIHLNTENDCQTADTSNSSGVEKMSEIDMKILINLSLPPKHVVLAGSIIMVLLSPGKDTPLDLSWKAFVRLLKHSNVVEKMNCFKPESVPKVKIVAIQGMLDQLSHPLPDMMDHNALPFPEYTAVHKLLTWVMQFTSSAMKKLYKKQKMIQVSSKSPESKKDSVPKVPKDKSAIPKSNSKKLPIKDLPKRKSNEIPKMNFELVPFHTESFSIDSVSPSNRSKVKQLMLILLTSSDRLASDNTLSAEFSSAVDEPPRLVVKVYDLSNSMESVVQVNIREYALHKQDILRNLQDQNRLKEVSARYRPEELSWWRDNSMKFVTVSCKNENELKVSISKKRIEQFFHDHVQDTPISSSTSRISMVEQKKNEIKLASKFSEIESTETRSSATVQPNDDIKQSIPPEIDSFSRISVEDAIVGTPFPPADIDVISIDESGAVEPSLPTHNALAKIMTMDMTEFASLLIQSDEVEGIGSNVELQHNTEYDDIMNDYEKNFDPFASEIDANANPGQKVYEKVYGDEEFHTEGTDSLSLPTLKPPVLNGLVIVNDSTNQSQLYEIDFEEAISSTEQAVELKQDDVVNVNEPTNVGEETVASPIEIVKVMNPDSENKIVQDAAQLSLGNNNHDDYSAEVAETQNSLHLPEHIIAQENLAPLPKASNLSDKVNLMDDACSTNYETAENHDNDAYSTNYETAENHDNDAYSTNYETAENHDNDAYSTNYETAENHDNDAYSTHYETTENHDNEAYSATENHDNDAYSTHYETAENHEKKSDVPTDIENASMDYTPFQSVSTHSPNQEEEHEIVKQENPYDQEQYDLEEDDYEIDF